MNWTMEKSIIIIIDFPWFNSLTLLRYKFGKFIILLLKLLQWPSITKV